MKIATLDPFLRRFFVMEPRREPAFKHRRTLMTVVRTMSWRRAKVVPRRRSLRAFHQKGKQPAQVLGPKPQSVRHSWAAMAPDAARVMLLDVPGGVIHFASA